MNWEQERINNAYMNHERQEYSLKKVRKKSLFTGPPVVRTSGVGRNCKTYSKKPLSSDEAFVQA